MWDTNTGDEQLTLEGHRNVVYAIAFNNPYGDKIITGSFDKTCRLWDSKTGELSMRNRNAAERNIFHEIQGNSTILSKDTQLKLSACPSTLDPALSLLALWIRPRNYGTLRQALSWSH